MSTTIEWTDESWAFLAGCQRISPGCGVGRHGGCYAELLTATGHTVLAAAGGEAAIAEFRPDRFDVVLSNLGMPNMNGWELAERLRAAHGQIADDDDANHESDPHRHDQSVTFVS